MHARVVRYLLPFKSQVHSAAFNLHALFIMPKRTHMQQLEATLNDKVKQLGRAKARKVVVDTQNRLLEDAVEHCCKAIAKAQDASSSDSSGATRASPSRSVPQRAQPQKPAQEVPPTSNIGVRRRVRGKQQVESAAQPGAVMLDADERVDGWLPADGTWEELVTGRGSIHGRRVTSHPEEACCAGTGKDGVACTRSSHLRRANTTMLRKWPATWDRSKVRLNPYPLLCRRCDNALRRF